MPSSVIRRWSDHVFCPYRGNLLLDCTTYDGKDVCFPEGGDVPEQCAPVQTPVTAALSTLMQDGQVSHPFSAVPLAAWQTLAAKSIFALQQDSALSPRKGPSLPALDGPARSNLPHGGCIVSVLPLYIQRARGGLHGS